MIIPWRVPNTGRFSSLLYSKHLQTHLLSSNSAQAVLLSYLPAFSFSFKLCISSMKISGPGHRLIYMSNTGRLVCTKRKLLLRTLISQICRRERCYQMHFKNLDAIIRVANLVILNTNNQDYVLGSLSFHFPHLYGLVYGQICNPILMWHRYTIQI